MLCCSLTFCGASNCWFRFVGPSCFGSSGRRWERLQRHQHTIHVTRLGLLSKRVSRCLQAFQAEKTTLDWVTAPYIVIQHMETQLQTATTLAAPCRPSHWPWRAPLQEPVLGSTLSAVTPNHLLEAKPFAEDLYMTDAKCLLMI